MNILKHLQQRNLINCPPWLPDNTHYLTMMGSVAYQVSNDTSDCDVYGFAIPRKDDLFPHLKGEIVGFGAYKHGGNRFTNYQQHHIKDADALGGKGREYDLNIYGIVDYFQLCMECNPNMIDSMFTPANCIMYSTAVGELVRSHRRIFLCKKAYHTFKGYAYSQWHKILNKNKNAERLKELENKYLSRFKNAFYIIEEIDDLINTKLPHGLDRAELLEYRQLIQSKRVAKIASGENDYDYKFAYHIVRLVDECEQILEFGDIDLTRSKEYCKAIRRGEVPLKDIEDFFIRKDKHLDELYQRSTLNNTPRQDEIKQLLFDCLEHHYGSIGDCVSKPDSLKKALLQIESIVNSITKELHS